MAEESDPPRADAPEQKNLDGHEDSMTGGQGSPSPTRAAEARAAVLAAAEKTREAAEKTREVAGKAVEAVHDAKEKMGHNPHVAAAAERTRDAADRTIGVARDQVEQLPVVGTAVEKTLGASGKAARAVGRRARRHPRIAGGLVVSCAMIVTTTRSLRSRRRPGE